MLSSKRPPTPCLSGCKKTMPVTMVLSQSPHHLLSLALLLVKSSRTETKLVTKTKGEVGCRVKSSKGSADLLLNCIKIKSRHEAEAGSRFCGHYANCRIGSYKLETNFKVMKDNMIYDVTFGVNKSSRAWTVLFLFHRLSYCIS